MAVRPQKYYDPDHLIKTFDLRGKGGSIPQVNGEELQACCPFKHFKPEKGYYYERNPSFAINLATGQYNCYGCSAAGHDLYSLAWELGIDLTLIPRVDLERLPEAKHEEVIVSQLYLEILSAHREIAEAYLESRGLDPSMAEYFGMGATADGRTIYLPIFDRDGKLSAWSERHLDAEISRWMTQPEGVARAELLFGIHLATDRRVWLVESQMDAVRLTGWGFPSIGTLGAKVSKHQMELILEHFEEVYLVPQNDGAGYDWARRLIGGLHGRCRVLGVRLPERYKDVAEMTDRDEFVAIQPQLIRSKVKAKS